MTCTVRVQLGPGEAYKSIIVQDPSNVSVRYLKDQIARQFTSNRLTPNTLRLCAQEKTWWRGSHELQDEQLLGAVGCSEGNTLFIPGGYVLTSDLRRMAIVRVCEGTTYGDLDGEIQEELGLGHAVSLVDADGDKLSGVIPKELRFAPEVGGLDQKWLIALGFSEKLVTVHITPSRHLMGVIKAGEQVKSVEDLRKILGHSVKLFNVSKALLESLPICIDDIELEENASIDITGHTKFACSYINVVSDNEHLVIGACPMSTQEQVSRRLKTRLGYDRVPLLVDADGGRVHSLGEYMYSSESNGKYIKILAQYTHTKAFSSKPIPTKRIYILCTGLALLFLTLIFTLRLKCKREQN